MRVFLIVSAALALSACGGSRDSEAADEANMAASDNMMMDQNMAMDPMMNGNMAMDPMMNGTANGAVDPATQNLMQQDMNTNSPDTNLANGL